MLSICGRQLYFMMHLINAQAHTNQFHTIMYFHLQTFTMLCHRRGHIKIVAAGKSFSLFFKAKTHIRAISLTQIQLKVQS
jgi:hypothetical protein